MKTKFGSMCSAWMGWVLAATLALSAPAFAHPGGGAGGGGLWHAKRLSRLLDDVQATPAQRQEIQRIAQALEPQMKEGRQAHRALMEKNMQLLAAPVIDESAIEQSRLQMLAQHEQQSKRMSTAIVAMAQVLTPQQRIQLTARLKKHMGRHGGWHGGHPHHPGDANGGPPAGG